MSVAAAPPEEAAPARRPRPSLDERLAAAGARVPLYLFLGALLVQLVYLSQYAVSPFFWVPELDQVYHDLCARQIVAGHLDPRPYFRAPLYVYLLGGVYAVFGRSFWAARLVQAVMQAAAVVLLWRLGRRAGVRPSVAAAAGTMMALSGPLVFAAGELHTPGVELFCNVLLLNLAVAPPANPARCPLWALAAGLALGLSGVARPTVLTTAPVLLWWLWARWTVPADGPRRPTRFALLAALYLLGAAVAPGAATWRNYRTAGDPVIVASQGPINLWIGNRDYADGFTSSTPRRYRFDGEYEDSVALFAQRAAEEATGHRMTVTETERYWTAETLKWVRAHPAMTLGLAWKKWVLLWGHREVRNNTAFEYVRREWAPVLWLLPFGMGIVGPLALVGIALAWRRDPPLRMLSLWALVYLAGYLPFFVADRYRLPAVPVLILLAAHALVWLAGRLRAREWRPLTPVLALLAGAAVFVNVNWWDTAPPQTWALDYWSCGNRYAAQHKYPEAEAQFRKAAALDPENNEVWLNLGGALYHQRRFAEAAPAFERAIQLAPDNASGYFNLAMLYSETKRPADARRLLETAVRVEPEYTPARRALAELKGN